MSKCSDELQTLNQVSIVTLVVGTRPVRRYRPRSRRRRSSTLRAETPRPYPPRAPCPSSTELKPKPKRNIPFDLWSACSVADQEFFKL